MNADTWDPAQYERFAAERQEPFWDLLALCEPAPGGRVVDLGCGTGELTVEVHRRLGAKETIGIDRSAAMLGKTGRFEDVPGLRFEWRDIASWPGPDDDGGFDVVFSNATLQWLPDHPELLARLAGALRPGGQLAVQVPANYDHPSHTLARATARELGFDDTEHTAGVLPVERYQEILWELGFARRHVRLQVYGHVLASTDELVEWTKGTLLTEYRARLTPPDYDRFLAEYQGRLRAELGDRRPYLYAFKRILFWARRAE